MGRRKHSRDQKRANRKRILSSKRNRAQVEYTNHKLWLLKFCQLLNITPPKNTWPKTKAVCWETLPSLIEALDKDGLLSSHLKEKDVKVWDPCYHDGKVASTWKRVGISVTHTREDFWTIWPQKVTKRTVVITNPPFQRKWLEPFFAFLTTLDQPFLIILPNTASNRLYFGKYLYDRIKKKSELEIFSLQKAHRMMQKGGRLAGFAGLTICLYYPKRWNFTLDETKFQRIITTRSLHSK